MKGHRLLLLRPMLVDPKDATRFAPGNNTIIAVDTLGAGNNEMVMFVQGSSARQCGGLKSLPIDAAVVGIVDSVNVQGRQIFSAGSDSTSS